MDRPGPPLLSPYPLMRLARQYTSQCRHREPCALPSHRPWHVRPESAADFGLRANVERNRLGLTDSFRKGPIDRRTDRWHLHATDGLALNQAIAIDPQQFAE